MGVVADDGTAYPADEVILSGGSYGGPAILTGPTDPWAVVDSLGLVQGVDRLRVVVASVIPEIPSTVTNLTVIMLASGSSSGLSPSQRK